MDKINYYGVSRADYQACQEQIDRHATTYLVFVVLVAVLLTDKFWTTGAFYLAMLLVLSFCSYYFKGPIMWELDSFNGLTFTLVALALNYIVQRERIASFLLFNKYKENQRELRVQANFDYLSGVILRSTFMDLSQKAIEQPECTDFFISAWKKGWKSITGTWLTLWKSLTRPRTMFWRGWGATSSFLPATARRKRLALRKCRACRRLLPRRRSH
ncbi:hypothetical protein ACIA4P_03465 [Lactobacillus delbrueckii subsp. bulgaricus]